MKKLSILIICISLLAGSFTTVFSNSMDWGKNGHRAVGEIAEKYLSKRAKKNIMKLLDGRTLAFVSTYADELYSDDNYSEYKPWHYVNFPFDSTYEEHPKSEKGDIIVGIKPVKKFFEMNILPETKRYFI